VILGRWRQMPGHSILPDLIADSRKRAVVFDPDLLEPLLPVGSLQAEFFALNANPPSMNWTARSIVMLLAIVMRK